MSIASVTSAASNFLNTLAKRGAEAEEEEEEAEVVKEWISFPVQSLGSGQVSGKW